MSKKCWHVQPQPGVFLRRTNYIEMDYWLTKFTDDMREILRTVIDATNWHRLWIPFCINTQVTPTRPTGDRHQTDTRPTSDPLTTYIVTRANRNPDTKLQTPNRPIFGHSRVTRCFVQSVVGLLLVSIMCYWVSSQTDLIQTDWLIGHPGQCNVLFSLTCRSHILWPGYMIGIIPTDSAPFRVIWFDSVFFRFPWLNWGITWITINDQHLFGYRML